MKDFNDILNSDISDELLAAYIDGNTSERENALIESNLNGDSMLSEAYEIASDSVSFGSDFEWELHKGDFGFWELGLPPIVGETDVDQHTNFEIQEDVSLSPIDGTITGMDTINDDISNYDITNNDSNISDF